jgi:ABC-type Zn uptake system ZnuABC Zn-binding protein ZnuA
MSHLPPEKRCVLTTHDGLGYFAQAYGLECLSPWGLSTDTEPSAKDVALLITQARQRGVKVVFLENILSPHLMHQIAHTEGMAIGGTLYVDGLSDAQGPSSTYIDMMTHNTRTVIQGLLAQK